MKIEMHCHTKYSPCSNIKVKQLIKQAKQEGLDGVCITDHNCFKGALEAEKINKDKQFKIIKGIEFSTNIGHLIGIFLKKEIIYDKKNQTTEWLINEIHKQKGLVILPHPYSFFRLTKTEYEKIKNLEIDAIEIYNGRNYFNFENEQCKEFARKLNKPSVAGSDAHFIKEIGTHIIECDNPHIDIKKGKIKIINKKQKNLIKIIINLFKSGMLKKYKKIIS